MRFLELMFEYIEFLLKNTMTQGLLTSNINDYYTSNIVFKDILGIDQKESI